MSKIREIYYEPHPVSKERKAELIQAGYKIVDAKYAPEPIRKPTEKPQGDFDADTAKAYLSEKGVEFPTNIGKAKLEKLFKETKASENSAES